MKKFDYMVFCDFDGTATAWETSEALLELLIGSDRFNAKIKQLLADHIGTSQGIKELYQMISSDRYPELLDYVKTIKLRDGFVDFLFELKKRNIPIVLISGAVTEMVYAVLEQCQDLFLDIYCCTLDKSSSVFHVSSDFDDGVDLLRKELVMQRYDYKTSIFIGDSYTDMNAAQKADIVFARDRLETFLDNRNISYHPFDSFHDIIETFQQEGFANI
ncbi:MAG: HAD-IB family phosphatase [Clostridium sp.]